MRDLLGQAHLFPLAYRLSLWLLDSCRDSGIARHLITMAVHSMKALPHPCIYIISFKSRVGLIRERGCAVNEPAQSSNLNDITALRVLALGSRRTGIVIEDA